MSYPQPEERLRLHMEKIQAHVARIQRALADYGVHKVNESRVIFTGLDGTSLTAADILAALDPTTLKNLYAAAEAGRAHWQANLRGNIESWHETDIRYAFNDLDAALDD